MQVRIEKGQIHITLPVLAEPEPSATGKTLLVTPKSERGNKPTVCKVAGRDVFVGVNAFVYAGDK